MLRRFETHFRPESGDANSRRACARWRSRPHRDGGRRGAALRPHAGPRPPRHQARQHLAGRRGQALCRRFRSGADRRGSRPSPQLCRDAGVHESGTGAGRSAPRGRAFGYFQPGSRAVRVADRRQAVLGRIARSAVAANRARRAAAVAGVGLDDRRGTGADLPEGLGQAGHRPVRVRADDGRRSAALRAAGRVAAGRRVVLRRRHDAGCEQHDPRHNRCRSAAAARRAQRVAGL